MMEMSVVRELPEDSWRAFVAEHPQGNIFHTPEMFQLFNRLDGHHPELWAVMERDQILTLMLPVRMSVLGGVLRRFTSRSVVLNRLLCLPNASGQAALDLLLQTYKREVGKSILFTRIYNMTESRTMRQLVEQHDFVYEEGAKYVTHLDRPVDAIFQSFDRRVRNHIRSGLRKGQVVIEEVSKREQLRAFYAVLCQSAQAKTFALAEYALFEAIFEVLYPKGMVKFMVARVADTLAAAYVKLLYKGTIYSWYGGMDRAYRSHRPNELLIWHMLQWGAENGYQLYDFGGSGMQDEGVDLSGFKRKFGGATIPFGRHTYAHFPFALQFSQWGYGAYRQLLGAAAKIRPGMSS